MKKNIFTLLFVSLTFTGYSQTKISGVITYYFNEYKGYKPDVGASVILIDSLTIRDFNYKLYEKFYYGKSYQDLYFGAMELYDKFSSSLKKMKKGKKYDKDRKIIKWAMKQAQESMERNKKQLVKYEYDTPQKYLKIGVDLYIQLLKLDEDLPKKTVDNNGNYSMNINPGVYYVYIKSKNRTGLLIPETDGKIYIKKIKILENSDKDISYNFELE